MDKPKLTVVGTVSTADYMDARSVIGVLENALKEARAGNVLACAIALVGTDRRIGYYTTESARHAVQLVAASNLMNWRLCESMWTTLDVQTDEIPDPPEAC